MMRAGAKLAWVMGLALALPVTADPADPAAPVLDKPVVPVYVAPAVEQLSSQVLRTFKALEADQGVAADDKYFYAIDNSVIAKHDIASGALAGRWIGPGYGLIRHLNSCFAEDGSLWCANSNYSQTPMGSSIERFDTATMTHSGSHSLGLLDEGSLTWFSREGDGWIAGFAHYDEKGSVGYKDHRYSSIVHFDAQWRRDGGWLLPGSVLKRMAPHSASGGAIGTDGLLYVMGHDRPEMYVLAAPRMGPTLIHIATITLEAQGQAFCWAPDGQREIFTIDRQRELVRRIRLPEIGDLDPDARPFTTPD